MFNAGVLAGTEFCSSGHTNVSIDSVLYKVNDLIRFFLYHRAYRSNLTQIMIESGRLQQVKKLLNSKRKSIIWFTIDIILCFMF
jgi:hypothetical protein